MNNTIADAVLFIAFCASLYASTLLALYPSIKNISVYISGVRGIYSAFFLTLLSLGQLIYALLSNDFSVKIIATNSETHASFFIKCISLLAGESGFLLLFTAGITSVTFFFLRPVRVGSCKLKPRLYHTDRPFYFVPLFFSVSSTFLLFLISSVNSPFAHSNSIPDNGFGIHPALRSPSILFLISHSILLIISYICIMYTFFYTLGMLLTKNIGGKTAKDIRIGSLLGWFFLTVSTVIGSRWATFVKGWGGGYISFDIVFIATIIPVILLTAYLHSIIIEEKRGMLKIWNVVLIIFIFHSLIFCLYASRSEHYRSVHFFSKSPSADYFLYMLFISLFLSITLLLKRISLLKSEHRLEAILSRESSFLLNNLLLLALAFVLLWGIIFPLLSSILNKDITVGPLYYKDMTIPIGISLIFLTAICPLLGWKKTSVSNLLKNGSYSFFISLFLASVIIIALGISKVSVILTIWSSFFVIISVLHEFLLGIRIRGKKNLYDALLKIIAYDRRRYGGYIVHVGMIIIFLGIAGSAYERHETLNIKNGEYVSVGKYRFFFRKIDDNYAVIDSSFLLSLDLHIEKDGIKKGILTPKMEFTRRWEPYSHPAIYSTFFEDIFVRWTNYSTSNGSIGVEITISPFRNLIWLGSAVLFLGTLIALIPLKKRSLRVSAVIIAISLFFHCYDSSAIAADARQDPIKAVNNLEDKKETDKKGNKHIINGIITLKKKDDASDPLKGLTVILNSHGKDGIRVTEGQTGDNGEFLFELDNDDNSQSYYVTVVYKGVTYGSDIISFRNIGAGDTGERFITITVYDNTQDKDVISVDEHTISADVDLSKKLISVEETITLHNNSDDIFIGSRSLYHDKNEVMRITLPEDHKELIYKEGLDVSSSFHNSWGILYTVPIKPGIKKISFSYNIDIIKPDCRLLWIPYFKTKKIKLYFKNIGAAIKTDTLLYDGIEYVRGIGKKGGFYLSYKALNKKPGIPFRAEIYGLLKKKDRIRPIAAFAFISLFIGAIAVKKYSDAN